MAHSPQATIRCVTWDATDHQVIDTTVRCSARERLCRSARLYEHTLPRYDEAWQELSEEIAGLGGLWDQRYADVRNYLEAPYEDSIVSVNWPQFLTADAPVTTIDGLREGNVFRVWDRFMTPGRFKLLDLSVEQFLIQRWHEVAKNDAIKQYRESRARALEDIPKAINQLDRNSLY